MNESYRTERINKAKNEVSIYYKNTINGWNQDDFKKRMSKFKDIVDELEGAKADMAATDNLGALDAHAYKFIRLSKDLIRSVMMELLVVPKIKALD